MCCSADVSRLSRTVRHGKSLASLEPVPMQGPTSRVPIHTFHGLLAPVAPWDCTLLPFYAGTETWNLDGGPRKSGAWPESTDRDGIEESVIVNEAISLQHGAGSFNPSVIEPRPLRRCSTSISVDCKP